MGIVILVASIACCWRIQKRAVGMAIQARGFPVLAKQRVVRCIVIKFCIHPFGGLVTGLAVIPHSLGMG